MWKIYKFHFTILTPEYIYDAIVSDYSNMKLFSIRKCVIFKGNLLRDFYFCPIFRKGIPDKTDEQ